VISENGPDHEKIFEVGLYLEEELVAMSPHLNSGGITY
jgi:hypothetical protein